MRATRRRKLTGLMYVLPALLFVLAFTVYPFIHMVRVSLNDWTLITPPEYVGLDNFERAFDDEQFWRSLRFTLKYTILITPILIVGGYLIALLTAANTPAAAVHAGRRLHPGRHRPGGVEPAVVLAVQRPLRAREPGADRARPHRRTDPLARRRPDTSTWAVIISVTWKVLGFGMILFIAAIQAIPTEITEAAKVDGASAWQRTTRVTIPLTMRTILLVTLVSVIGSLLAFDQFYIMTAGQPTNQTATSVFYVYLNSFPFLKLGYGAALSLILAAIILLFTVTQMILTRRSHS